MLTTIISRCQVIHFKPIKNELLEEKLINKGVERDVAYVLSHLTSNEQDAQKLINEGNVTSIIETIKKILISEINNQDKYNAYLLNSLSFPKKDNIFNRMFLEIYSLFLEEKIHYIESPTLDKHFVEVFKELDLDNVDIKETIKQLDTICEYEKRLNSHPNADLMYASLFIEL